VIQSLQKIEHVQEDGSITLLLDFGDFIEEEIEFGAEQQTTGFAPIGAMWGIGTPDGGARRTFSYSVRRQHSSHSQARSWCLSHPSLIPFNKDGVLRISIRDAVDSDVEIWEIQSAVIQGCSARPLFDLKQTFRSLTTYQITGGEAVPIQGNFGQCYPIGWQTYIIDEDESIIGDDECDVVPPYVPDPPTPGTPGELEPEVGVEYPWPPEIQITGTGLDVGNSTLNAILGDVMIRVSNDGNGNPRWSSDGVWSLTGGPRILVSPSGISIPGNWNIIGVDSTDSVLNESFGGAQSPEFATFNDFSAFVVGGAGVPSIVAA
jgi:hypothetical protein